MAFGEPPFNWTIFCVLEKNIELELMHAFPILDKAMSNSPFGDTVCKWTSNSSICSVSTSLSPLLVTKVSQETKSKVHLFRQQTWKPPAPPWRSAFISSLSWPLYAPKTKVSFSSPARVENRTIAVSVKIPIAVIIYKELTFYGLRPATVASPFWIIPNGIPFIHPDHAKLICC